MSQPVRHRLPQRLRMDGPNACRTEQIVLDMCLLGLLLARADRSGCVSSESRPSDLIITAFCPLAVAAHIWRLRRSSCTPHFQQQQRVRDSCAVGCVESGQQTSDYVGNSQPVSMAPRSNLLAAALLLVAITSVASATAGVAAAGSSIVGLQQQHSWRRELSSWQVSGTSNISSMYWRFAACQVTIQHLQSPDFSGCRTRPPVLRGHRPRHPPICAVDIELC